MITFACEAHMIISRTPRNLALIIGWDKNTMKNIKWNHRKNREVK